MNPVVQILKDNREQLIDDLVGSLVETVPRYALAESSEVRANVTMLFDEFMKVIETGASDRLTEQLKVLAKKRVEQGFTPADFMRALLMVYPTVRSVVRKAGPRADAVFARMFEEVENAVFHMISLASNIYAANVVQEAEVKSGELEVEIEELREHERELEQRTAEQKVRLHASEQLNSRVIASLSSGIIVVEMPSTHVLMWSPRAADITGIPEDKAIGRPFGDVVRPLEGLQYGELLATIQATDRLPMTKVQLQVAGGMTRSLFVRAERLRQPDRRSHAGTVIVVDDITEREMLIDSFSRYVSKEVVQRLLSRSGRSPKLEGERRACSILFADIRGFTGISERVTPEALHELLNHYFRLMIEQCSAHDGIIDKFIGDKIMAIFTGGEGEGASSAVRAALAIQSEIAKLNAQRQTENAEPITVGIGVNTGTVVMGTVGSEERMSFTVIGDPVNVADRLQSMAGAGEIFVGARTRELVKAAFRLEELGSRAIKGRINPEEMFRLVGELTVKTG